MEEISSRYTKWAVVELKCDYKQYKRKKRGRIVEVSTETASIEVEFDKNKSNEKFQGEDVEKFLMVI